MAFRQVFVLRLLILKTLVCVYLVLMWIGMVGGFLFILIQLVLIVDFAHGLAEVKWKRDHLL